MAQFLLLLKVRLLLMLRRFQGKTGLLILVLVATTILTIFAFSLADRLNTYHSMLEDKGSQNLYDLTALFACLFMLVTPLMGFRANEALDVSKLFQYPVRPSQVFLSSVIGQMFSGTLLFFLPILLIPGVLLAENLPEALIFLAAGLLLLFVVHCLVQCLLLLLLNVLRSRRFSDLVAILAPMVGIGSYLAFRFAFMRDLGDNEMEGEQIRQFLENLEIASLRPFLPPLWFSAIPYLSLERKIIALSALALLLVPLLPFGVRLTIKAFHGEIAITPSDKGTERSRGLLRGILTKILPIDLGALYEKEMDLIKREPFLRSLFLQQVGMVVLFIFIGRTWEHEGSTVDSGLVAPVFILLFAESGLLLNTLGFEGRSLAQTALLPLPSFRILMGKNVAHFHLFAMINLVLIPLLGLISSFLDAGPYPLRNVLQLLFLSLAGLPILVGTGNLISVFFPTPLPQRGKRALGQERTGNEGCLQALIRSVFSTLGLVPLLIMAGIAALPLLLGDRIPFLGFGISLPIAVVFALAYYLTATHVVAHVLDRRWPKILEQVQ